MARVARSRERKVQKDGLRSKVTTAKTRADRPNKRRETRIRGHLE